MICREAIADTFWGPISQNPGFVEGHTFEGYRNADGSVGTRNILAITQTVQCVAGVTDFGNNFWVALAIGVFFLAAALFWFVIFSERYCADWLGTGKQHLCSGLTVIEAGRGSR